MKKYFLPFLLFIVSLTTINFSFAQGVAVNTTGNTADPSAMLDVNATNKGILIPRVTSTSSITSPVVGLLIFQTTAPIGFYYYDGATWDYLQNSANVTLQGNTFNGNNQLVQLNGTGKLPALDGSLLTNLPVGGAAAAGTLTGSTLASNVVNASITTLSPLTSNGIVTTNGGTGALSVTGTTGSGSVVLATSPTLVTPRLGTIASGNGAALTGLQNIANNSTAGNSIAAALGSATSGTTGSGNVVLATSPTFVTPNLGTPSSLVGTNISGTASSLTAGNVTTDANLTGDVISTGNATTYNNIVPIAKGGTGTATPALVAGSNITITGSFPNQTINATSGGGSSTLDLEATSTGSQSETTADVPINLAFGNTITATSISGASFDGTTYTAGAAGTYLVTVIVTSGTAFAYGVQIVGPTYTAYSGSSIVNAAFSPIGRVSATGIFKLTAGQTIKAQLISFSTSSATSAGSRITVVKL